MSKKKYVVVISSLTVVALIGAGIWYWHGHNKPKNVRNNLVATGSENQNLVETNDPNSIPLNRTRPNTYSGLSIASDTSENNLGQLIAPGASSSGSSTSSSSAPKAPDPTKFTEYEKYKDGDSALFGELQMGTGDELTPGKKAAVYYKGWLTNGELFDMSRPDKDGKLQPFIFELGAHQVIPGWEQALNGMKVGGTRLVIVPPAVGYGPSGQDPIPGNAVLVFQVQLLAVQ